MNKKQKSISSSDDLGMAAGGGEVDRISDLPEPIIHHILSFLDTQSAVKTCVLSKQWESAWKHVHTLNLELKFDEYSWYVMFVEKVLSFRHPLPVSKVLWHPYDYSYGPIGSEFSLLRRVVQYAVSHGAQHFDLQPRCKFKPDIPLFELFDSLSGTVTSLKLLRLLTTLKLQRCCLSADGELGEPFPQFPCLKELVLLDCWWVSKGDDYRPVRLRVCGLELDRLSFLNMHVWELEIFAPKLKYFKLISRGIMEFQQS